VADDLHENGGPHEQRALMDVSELCFFLRTDTFFQGTPRAHTHTHAYLVEVEDGLVVWAGLPRQCRADEEEASCEGLFGIIIIGVNTPRIYFDSLTS
jgi:hypothetical protein